MCTPTGNSEFIVTKDLLIKEDEDTYIARIDTALLGLGRIMFRITASLPDNDFEGGFREEVVPKIKTNIVIVK